MFHSVVSFFLIAVNTFLAYRIFQAEAGNRWNEMAIMVGALLLCLSILAIFWEKEKKRV